MQYGVLIPKMLHVPQPQVMLAAAFHLRITTHPANMLIFEKFDHHAGDFGASIEANTLIVTATPDGVIVRVLRPARFHAVFSHRMSPLLSLSNQTPLLRLPSLLQQFPCLVLQLNRLGLIPLNQRRFRVREQNFRPDQQVGLPRHVL